MCGVAGIWDRRGRRAPEALIATAAAMAETLRSRGPDGRGVWCDAAAGLALGHRRLSIIDLSPAGAQPMVSSCGRFVLSYNGEVYNATELRLELEAAGRRFRGHSDTEVIVEGVAAWGLEATVQRLIGMFAMALWDRRERVLCLIRDRIGIKPLYWTVSDGCFLFGSELKALRAARDWRPTLDRDVVVAFMRLGYVPAPFSIYRGVNKLRPGTILTLRPDGQPEIRAYWSLEDVARTGQSARLTVNDEEAAARLDALLRDAVRRHMVADVPLGAFLSGGIDSSTVVAAMQVESRRPVRTFSIGFLEQDYDEAKHAAAVARHLGTDHAQLYVAPNQALLLIPHLPEMYDEPLALSSQIPTFFLSEMTRRHVTVALSGDGGDELFAGYTRYFQAEPVFTAERERGRSFSRIPRPARLLAASGIRALAPWAALGRLIPAPIRPRHVRDRFYKLAGVLAEDGAGAYYRNLVSQWADPSRLVKGATEPSGPLDDPRIKEFVHDPIERMQYLDTVTYLPDAILTKVDRASMAVSLEVRVPLLDHRLVAFAWSLSPMMKAEGRAGKRLLRRVLDRYIPRALVERPKMGFSVPIGAWLRGPLRDWAEPLLAEARLRAEGVLHPEPIRLAWQELLAGRDWRQYPLWHVLMFLAWKERWLP